MTNSISRQQSADTRRSAVSEQVFFNEVIAPAYCHRNKNTDEPLEVEMTGLTPESAVHVLRQLKRFLETQQLGFNIRVRTVIDGQEHVLSAENGIVPPMKGGD